MKERANSFLFIYQIAIFYCWPQRSVIGKSIPDYYALKEGKIKHKEAMMWIWCKYGVKNGVTRALKLQFFARFCSFLQGRLV